MLRVRALLIPKSLNLNRNIILEKIIRAKKRPLSLQETLKKRTTIWLQKESIENQEIIATEEIMEQESTRTKAQKLTKEMELIDTMTQVSLMI